MSENIAAFCGHDAVTLAGAPDGPLAGLRFAVKDVFDIAGRVACCGNPDWLATHAPAARTAPAVQRLLDAGADLAGMTITEELVMGMTGENPFYGAPVNVNAPGRVCGGSSSGSAAAVAAGLVDFALGSDTGGSVRVPSSFCGLYGIRTTHGRLPVAGVLEQGRLAPVGAEAPVEGERGPPGGRGFRGRRRRLGGRGHRLGRRWRISVGNGRSDRGGRLDGRFRRPGVCHFVGATPTAGGHEDEGRDHETGEA